MILEKGIITPNALFEEMNPDIDAEFYNITVGHVLVQLFLTRAPFYLPPAG